MKKVFAVIAAVLIALAPVSALAADKTVTLPKLYLEVSVPEDWLVITRSVNLADPKLVGLGVTQIQSSMRENNSYFDAISPDMKFEMYIMMLAVSDNADIDINEIADNELQSFTEDLKTSYNQLGASFISVNKYLDAQVPFVVNEAKTDEFGSLQYITDLNHQRIVVNFHKSGGFTEADRAQAQTLVNNLHFTKVDLLHSRHYMDTSAIPKILTIILPCLIGLYNFIKGKLEVRKYRVKPSEIVPNGETENRLNQLELLHKSGLLSQEEYIEQKDKLRK